MPCPRNAAGWELSGSGAYVRPLVACELFLASLSRTAEGFNDCCMGFRFSTTVKDLKLAALEAVVRLRFFAPLIAADIQEQDNKEGLHWVYTPAEDLADAYVWAEETLIVHDAAPTDEEFILAMSERRLPYELHPQRKQYFSVHLLLRASGEHSVFTHGTHAILDARPNLRALRHFFRALSGELDQVPLSELSWGTEVGNLPVDIVTIMGGMVAYDSGSCKLELPEGLVMEKPSLGLQPQRELPAGSERPLRVHRVLDETMYRSLYSKAKSWGLTMTTVLEAAQVLTVFEMNKPLSEDSHVALDLSCIALHRFFPSGYDPESYITSCSAYLPLVVQLKELKDVPSISERLIRTATLLRDQYRRWTSNPNLPFTDVVGQPPRKLDANPYGVFTTNLNDIDIYVPPTFPIGSEAPTVKIHEFKFGHRIVHVPRPAVHIWTFRSKIYVQIQAIDVFDAKYLTNYIDQFVTTAKSILEDRQ